MAYTRRLPLPVAETWDWQLHAACRGLSSARFFHPDAERGPDRAERDERARKICRRCPVRKPCLDHALAAAEPYGIWGGTTPEERKKLRRARGKTAA